MKFAVIHSSTIAIITGYSILHNHAGKAGSCVAFAVTATMESRALITKLVRKCPKVPQLSPAHLYYYGNVGNFSPAYKFLINGGVTEESFCPYSDKKKTI